MGPSYNLHNTRLWRYIISLIKCTILHRFTKLFEPYIPDICGCVFECVCFSHFKYCKTGNVHSGKHWNGAKHNCGKSSWKYKDNYPSFVPLGWYKWCNLNVADVALIYFPVVTQRQIHSDEYHTIVLYWESFKF